jgi:dTDP-4-amino-4,6-dideoxygalactose transaminase
VSGEYYVRYCVDFVILVQFKEDALWLAELHREQFEQYELQIYKSGSVRDVELLKGSNIMSTRQSKRIFLSPPDMCGLEIQYIHKAFESNYIAPLGPMVDSFEKEFSKIIGISNCVAVSSGTAALHLALRHLNIGPEDEVFASTLTFIGSITPIIFQGARPVFIDSDRETWNMDPALLAEEIAECKKKGKFPKAVIPTDLYGQCADLDRISEICDPYNIKIIIDAAESVGSKYKTNSSGRGAWASTYSFNGNKIITTSGGGLLASEDGILIEHARKLSTQARDTAPHYEHSEIGYNYRMSNIIAAIGLGQLSVLEDRVKKRREIFSLYEMQLSRLPGISFMPEAQYGISNRWLTVILIDPIKFGATSEDVRCALEQENIESRPIWKPMHLQPVFRNNRILNRNIAENLFAQGLCLPSGTSLTTAEIERVSSIIMKKARQ